MSEQLPVLVTDAPVADGDWSDVLQTHFGIQVALDEPPERGNTVVR